MVGILSLAGDRVGPIQHCLPRIVFEIEDEHLAAVRRSKCGVGILQVVRLERSLDDAAGGRIIERVVRYFEIGVVLSASVLKIRRSEIVVTRGQDVWHLAIEHVEGLLQHAPIALRIDFDLRCRRPESPP